MARRLLRTKWHGSHEEMLALLNAINDACDRGPELCRRKADHTARSCSSHAILFEGQRRLDALLFARRIAHRLRAEEGLQSAV